MSEQMHILPLIVATLVGAVTAGLIGTVGNYMIQKKIRLWRDMDDLKSKYYDYMNITSRYWSTGASSTTDRQTLESQIMVAGSVLATDYSMLAKKSKSVRNSRKQTETDRENLLDAATGGCFQQKQWQVDPERSQKIAHMVTKIVASIHG